MRIAVLEAVTAGFFGPDPDPDFEPELSLLSEGLAMWSAVVTDLAAVPGVQVVTVVDRELRSRIPLHTSLHILWSDGPIGAANCWVAALEQADQVLVIAPEFAGLLTKLVAASAHRGTLWNAVPATIALCSDKLRLCEHLQQRGIPTISTSRVDWELPPVFSRAGHVIKPRDGVGSYLVRSVTNLSEWNQVRDEYAGLSDTEPLIQPYIPGRSISMAGWFRENEVCPLPIAEQFLSADGQFRYLGGRIPAAITEAEAAAVCRLFERVTRSLTGLRGYIGADLLLPDDDPLSPVLVEVNPRFTTSYVGYRQLWQQSPWPQWIQPAAQMESLAWSPGPVRFLADGTLQKDHQ